MIYTVPEEYGKLQQLMIDLEGEEGAEEAISEAFNDIMQREAEGAEYCAKIIRNAEALNAATALEAERLKSVVSVRKNRIKAAKDAVKASMIATGTKRIETSLGNFGLRKGSEKTVVKDEQALYQLAEEDDEILDSIKVETVRKPILAKIKELIGRGSIPENIAALERGEPSITFK